MNKLTIQYDDWCESPREWNDFSTMVCFHNRYNLGDKHDYRHEDYNSWEEMKETIIKDENVAVILPLYLYDHSGITMNTTGFSCGWDSGQVGWIFVSKSKVREEYSVKRISKKLQKRVEDRLLREVELYDHYIMGHCYSCTIEDENGELVDSCGGFIGDDPEENGIAEAAFFYFKDHLSYPEIVELCKEKMYGN